uniref:Uncharacterized protein n=1 Tax=Leersia perrieri TaxID=77586 RepID=A0A0D9V1U3_9ORYZ
MHKSRVVMVGGLYCVLWAMKSEHAGISKQQMAVQAQATRI